MSVEQFQKLSKLVGTMEKIHDFYRIDTRFELFHKKISYPISQKPSDI